jgi:hypothetical protein
MYDLKALPFRKASFSAACTGDESLGGLVVEDYIDPKGSGEALAARPRVDSDYFREMGMRLLSDRIFTEVVMGLRPA